MPQKAQAQQTLPPTFLSLLSSIVKEQTSPKRNVKPQPALASGAPSVASAALLNLSQLLANQDRIAQASANSVAASSVAAVVGEPYIGDPTKTCQHTSPRFFEVFETAPGRPFAPLRHVSEIGLPASAGPAGDHIRAVLPVQVRHRPRIFHAQTAWSASQDRPSVDRSLTSFAAAGNCRTRSQENMCTLSG